MKDKNSEILKKIQSSLSIIASGTALGSSIAINDPALLLSTGSAFATSLLGPVLKQRGDNFWNNMLIKLAEYKNKNKDFEIEKLAENENFVTIVLQAYRVAIQTHQKEKLEFLQNAALNSIKNRPSLEQEQQLTFFRYIEELETLHVRLMLFIENSKDEFDKITEDSKKEGVSYDYEDPNDPQIAWLLSHFPELQGTHQRYLDDLINRRLVEFGHLRLTHKFANIMVSGGLSKEGKQFLKFIESPLEKC